VANVVVFIELAPNAAGEPWPAEPSLETLGEGRRIASFLGATLYAALPCVSPPTYGDDDVIAVLGRHGADKVVLIAGPELKGPPLHASFGQAMGTVCAKIPPALLLVAATSGGRDLAPRLAAHLGAAYAPEPSIEYGPRGELVLSRTVYGGAFRRRLAADDLERPIVATLTPGSYLKAEANDEAEVVVLQGTGAPAVPFEEVSRKDDPGAALETARIVVTAGAGVKKEAYAHVVELARRLGGEVAVTHGAVSAGLAGAERAVGIGGRSISPRLYIACGASGSAEHLTAVSPDAEIVAINSDPNAPIFRVASYGIVGDVATVLPRLVASLAPRAKEAS
jgi:electron transfer flavoprotein alpha subunit